MFAQRKADRKTVWEGWLWDELETVAQSFRQSVRLLREGPAYDPRRALAWFDEIRELIDTFERKLQHRPLISTFAGFVYESYVSGELTTLRNTLTADADDLRRALAAQRGHAYGRGDCVAELKVILLRIGQDLLGSQKIGSARGPLVEFVRLALLPLLDDATPDAEALRKFAEDHKADVLALKPLAPLKPLSHS